MTEPGHIALCVTCGSSMVSCPFYPLLTFIADDDRYYSKRANYPAADQLVEAALFAAELACMLPRPLLAKLHRTRVALAFELGRSDREEIEVERFKELYRDTFPQQWRTRIG